MNNDKGIDKGFCLLYSKLSPRRKFIRSLWAFFWVSVVVFLTLPGDEKLFGIPWKIIYFVGVFVCLLVVVRDFRRWKKSKS